MKNYTITVNGIAYEVSVEENTLNTVSQQVQPATPVVQKAPQAAPAPKAETAPKKAATPAGAQGSVKVDCPMPGKILSVKASVGQSVKKGDVIIILEAMKMENEIVAAQDGTIASIDVNVGEMVEAGALLATLN